MKDGEEEPSSRIIHTGSGPQILGPNYGDIKYDIDPDTRVMLTKLSKDAAELADIGKQALRDGFMSRDTVIALKNAAQHVNDDLVDRLGYATRNLNEDNVDRLGYATRNLSEDNVDRLGWATQNITDETVNRLCRAAQDISGGTVDRFVDVNNDLNTTARSLEATVNSLRSVTIQAGGPQDSVQLFAPPSSKGNEKREFRFTLVLCIAGLMVLTGVALEKRHFGGYTVLAGVLGVAFPVLFWINKALSKSDSRGPINATQYDPDR